MGTNGRDGAVLRSRKSSLDGVEEDFFSHSRLTCVQREAKSERKPEDGLRCRMVRRIGVRLRRYGMTEQRQQRATFICEQPGLWLSVLYSVALVGCAVAITMLTISFFEPKPEEARVVCGNIPAME